MLGRPTLTRLRDPDTGLIVGAEPTHQQNWIGPITRLGSMYDRAVAVEEPVAPAPVKRLEILGETPPKVPQPGVPELKERILALRREAGEGSGEAMQDLVAIAAAEYTREDGGRIEVKRALASAGVKKPA